MRPLQVVSSLETAVGLPWACIGPYLAYYCTDGLDVDALAHWAAETLAVPSQGGGRVRRAEGRRGAPQTRSSTLNTLLKSRS